MNSPEGVLLGVRKTKLAFTSHRKMPNVIFKPEYFYFIK